jgi:hypothetical protein
LVPLHLVAEQPPRLGIKARHAQHDAVAIEHDADLGALCGRRPVVGVALQEVSRGDGVLPGRFVRRSVDDQRLGFSQAMGSDLRAGRLGCGLHCPRHQGDDNDKMDQTLTIR